MWSELLSVESCRKSAYFMKSPPIVARSGTSQNYSIVLIFGVKWEFLPIYTKQHYNKLIFKPICIIITHTQGGI